MLNKIIACSLKREQIPTHDEIIRGLYAEILARPHISEREFSGHEIRAYRSALRTVGIAVSGVVKYKINLTSGEWTYLGRTDGVSNDRSDFEEGKIPQPDSKRNIDKITMMQVLRGINAGTLDVSELQGNDEWIKNGNVIGLVVKSDGEEYAGRDAIYIILSTREEDVMESNVEIAVFLGHGLHEICTRREVKEGLCSAIIDIKDTAEIARRKASEEIRMMGVGNKLRQVAMGRAVVYKHDALQEDRFVSEEDIPREVRLMRTAHQKLMKRIAYAKDRLSQNIQTLEELGHNTRDLQENLGRLDGEEMLAETILVDSGERSDLPEELRFAAKGLEIIIQETRRDVFSALALKRKYIDWVIQKTKKSLLDKGKPIEEVERDHFVELFMMYNNLLDNLEMELRKDAQAIKEGDIVVAKNLMNSVVMELISRGVTGVAVEAGGEASHILIAARGSKLPAMVGLTGIVDMVDTGQQIVFDCHTGEIVVNPKRATLREFETRKMHYNMLNQSIEAERALHCQTLDGTEITIRANVGRIDEAEVSSGYGASGIGLVRTEYLYMNKVNLPSEEELTDAFVRIAKTTSNNTVIIRTLDIGGDKAGEVFKLKGVSSDMNMMDYYRGKKVTETGEVSYSDDEEGPKIFRTQVRAILRASGISENIKILFPMVSTEEEAEYLLRVVGEEKDKLRRDLADETVHLKVGHKLFNEDIEIGCMIETPDAVKNSKALAKKFRFFNVGTNDLTKLTYNIQRHDVSLDLQRSPEVLLQIKDVVEAANETGIRLDVCGEMAGDLLSALVLVGLGVRELSMSPAIVPYVKALLRRINLDVSKQIAEMALQNISPSEFRRKVFDLLSTNLNYSAGDLGVFNLLL